MSFPVVAAPLVAAFPLAIADLLKIRVEANSDVADARTITVGGKIRIEFNPTRPRERVRFHSARDRTHTL